MTGMLRKVQLGLAECWRLYQLQLHGRQHY